MKKWLRAGWGVLPPAAVGVVMAAAAVYGCVTDSALRSAPQLALLWAQVAALLAFAVWLALLTRRVWQGGARRAVRTACVILCAAVMALSVGALVLAPFSSVFGYQPEHVVERDGEVLLARVSAWLDTYVSYYPYRGALFYGTQERGNAWYGSGGFDPFETEPQPQPRRWRFYDAAGNLTDSGG